MTQFQLAGFLPLRLVVLASNAPVQPGDRLCLLPGPEAGTARLTAPGSRCGALGAPLGTAARACGLGRSRVAVVLLQGRGAHRRRRRRQPCLRRPRREAAALASRRSAGPGVCGGVGPAMCADAGPIPCQLRGRRAARPRTPALGVSPKTQRPCRAAQVKKRHVTCIAQVTAADASAVTVLLAVQVGRDTWASHRRWPAGDKPALLFVHLVPPALPADSPAHAQQQQRPASYVEQLAQALEEQGIKRPASDADAFRCAPATTPRSHARWHGCSSAACWRLPRLQPGLLLQLAPHEARAAGRGPDAAHRQQPPLPPQLGARASRVSLRRTRRAARLHRQARRCDVPPARPRPRLQLDARVTNEVLSWLDLRSLVNLAATCRHFKDRCLEAAPGLQLALFPHQVGAARARRDSSRAVLASTPRLTRLRAAALPPPQREAVLWMQQRERASGPMPHPTIRTFQCLELAPDDDPFVAAPNGLACTGDAVRLADLELGLPLWADTATGELWTEEPSDLPDSPGGLFCDEPGLGKTITTVGRPCTGRCGCAATAGSRGLLETRAQQLRATCTLARALHADVRAAAAACSWPWCCARCTGCRRCRLAPP